MKGTLSEALSIAFGFLGAALVAMLLFAVFLAYVSDSSKRNQFAECQVLNHEYTSSMNCCCWYRSVRGWRPGQVRHWVSGEAAIIADEETGYAQEVKLENLNFRYQRP